MQVALLTREYPPEVYGGAGVHVEYLSRHLADQIDVAVHAFGKPRPDPLVAATYEPWDALAGADPYLGALRTLSVDLTMVAGVAAADVVHSHTWYANLAGHFAKLVHGAPHVVTTHSLEPLRPWKAEQLGGGYALSSFCEQTGLEGADAVIAVSQGMRDDILRSYPALSAEKIAIIHNGIDPDEYRPVSETAALDRHGIDPDRPYAAFVGRITRQKGVVHLLEAARHLPDGSQLVLCAGAPDTPAIAAEFRTLIDELAASAGGASIVWIEDMLPRAEVVQILSHARVFVCPSIYEPFGIVNLEAMACGAPVVATAVGGIPEIVVPGETGYLVPFEPGDDQFSSPRDREGFAEAFAAEVTRVLEDGALSAQLGAAGRARVEEHFSWAAIAERTAELYATLL